MVILLALDKTGNINNKHSCASGRLKSIPLNKRPLVLLILCYAFLKLDWYGPVQRIIQQAKYTRRHIRTLSNNNITVRAEAWAEIRRMSLLRIRQNNRMEYRREGVAVHPERN